MMQKKFLKEVVVITVGKSAEDIAEILDSKKHVNEFLIAKKMDLTINQTRNILYKLSDFGLVSSIRKKDKKKGWYTYFWKIEILKTLEFLKKTLLKRIEQLSFQIKSREAKTFYACERCNIEFNEENALSYDFTCNECGDIFKIKNNSKILKELKKDSDRLSRELSLVENEIEKEREKEIKKSSEKKPKTKKTIKKTDKKITKKKISVKKPKKSAKKKIGKKSIKKKITKKKVIKKKTTKKSTKKKIRKDK